MTTPTVHANAVLIGAEGVLIRGRPGSGKSALTRALIAAATAEGRFARLVADDRVGLTACHGRLIARPPASLAGLAERRGRGIEAAEHENAAVVRLVVDLVAAAEAERMPAPAALETEILGVSLPRQPVACGAAEAAGLVLAALAAAVAARAADQSATAPAPLFACAKGEPSQS
ncbi:HPr kinase/phosphatase C-terminal domain-containing protein [Pseudoxanthobacter sp. M-2]|uniref:HPr kinase/phosphorylase n=1 Tax=Pseudoxanthobacter sp. M-2 TaxID=3078754 RepID=UPI0038FC865F